MREIRVLQQVGTAFGIPILVDPTMPPDRIDLVEGNDLSRATTRLVNIGSDRAAPARGEGECSGP